MSSGLIPALVTGLTALVIALAPLSPTIARQGSVLLSLKPEQAQTTVQAKAALKPEEIREAEQRLSDLGYWTGPIDGKIDDGSRHALIAFQKVEGLRRTGKLTRELLDAIRTADRPKPIEAGLEHVEIDIARQVLFMVEGDGTVARILPVSTGTGKFFTEGGWTRRACTPCGRFTVYRKISGWRKSPLGLLYYPNYIQDGVAIHGNPSVPASPASHGCIRIPMFAAKQFSEMTPIGTVVIIHDAAAPSDDPPAL
jgi:peptidoglycan hydrolase-like protein with peptidoglycan-binding domain